VLAGFAHSQQIDLAVGTSGLLSSTYTTSSQAYLPPAEKGGMYPSVSASLMLKNRIGVSGEVAARSSQGFYNGYQAFRPVLYDFNAVFAPRINKKISVDLMAGVGGETIIFYNNHLACTFPGGCPTRLTGTHLLGHVSADVRYYFWRSFFVRPEVHYYLIHNNFQFASGNLGRIGVSLGYTFKPK
jgi:hypothetical protein